MSDGIRLRYYDLRDTGTLKDAHSYKAWRHDTVRFTFTLQKEQIRWDIADADNAPAGTLIGCERRTDPYSLTLQLPRRSDVTIELVQQHPQHWQLVNTTIHETLTTDYTSRYSLPMRSPIGTRFKHHVLAKADGTECAGIHAERADHGSDYSVVVTQRFLPVIALALGVAIAYRESGPASVVTNFFEAGAGGPL